MKNKEKYPLEEIKALRLKGYTLQDIADYYGLKCKGTISIHLKRKYGVAYWQLPLKCRWCGQIFIPSHSNERFCSEDCRYYHTLERHARNGRRYYKKYYKDKLFVNPDLDRANPINVYKDSLNFLNTKKETCICPLCGNSDENLFEICRGEIVCNVCQLVQE